MKRADLAAEEGIMAGEGRDDAEEVGMLEPPEAPDAGKAAAAAKAGLIPKSACNPQKIPQRTFMIPAVFMETKPVKRQSAGLAGK
jgi:hypothetical protein